jgi:hypothetical protein
MVLWTVLFFWNLQGWFISLQGSVLLTEEQIYPSHLGPLYTMDFTTGLYHLRYGRQELHEIQWTSIYDAVCIYCTIEQLLMLDLAFQGGLCLILCKMTWRLCSTVFCLCSWDVLGQDISCVWFWTRGEAMNAHKFINLRFQFWEAGSSKIHWSNQQHTMRDGWWVDKKYYPVGFISLANHGG